MSGFRMPKEVLDETDRMATGEPEDEVRRRLLRGQRVVRMKCNGIRDIEATKPRIPQASSGLRLYLTTSSTNAPKPIKRW
jgi:hypothetical protein